MVENSINVKNVGPHSIKNKKSRNKNLNEKVTIGVNNITSNNGKNNFVLIYLD